MLRTVIESNVSYVSPGQAAELYPDLEFSISFSPSGYIYVRVRTHTRNIFRELKDDLYN